MRIFLFPSFVFYVLRFTPFLLHFTGMNRRNFCACITKKNIYTRKCYNILILNLLLCELLREIWVLMIERERKRERERERERAPSIYSISQSNRIYQDASKTTEDNARLTPAEPIRRFCLPFPLPLSLLFLDADVRRCCTGHTRNSRKL